MQEVGAVEVAPKHRELIKCTSLVREGDGIISDYDRSVTVR